MAARSRARLTYLFNQTNESIEKNGDVQRNGRHKKSFRLPVPCYGHHVERVENSDGSGTGVFIGLKSECPMSYPDGLLKLRVVEAAAGVLYREMGSRNGFKKGGCGKGRDSDGSRDNELLSAGVFRVR